MKEWLESHSKELAFILGILGAIYIWILRPLNIVDERTLLLSQRVDNISNLLNQQNRQILKFSEDIGKLKAHTSLTDQRINRISEALKRKGIIVAHEELPFKYMYMHMEAGDEELNKPFSSAVVIYKPKKSGDKWVTKACIIDAKKNEMKIFEISLSSPTDKKLYAIRDAAYKMEPTIVTFAQLKKTLKKKFVLPPYINPEISFVARSLTADQFIHTISWLGNPQIKKPEKRIKNLSELLWLLNNIRDIRDKGKKVIPQVNPPLNPPPKPRTWNSFNQ